MRLLNRIYYRVQKAIGTGWHFLTQRLTPAGWLVVAGALLSLALTGDLDSTVTYEMFLFFTALLIAGLAGAFFYRARFEVRRELPRVGSVGQVFRYRVTVWNRSGKWQSGLILLEQQEDPRPGFESWLEWQQWIGRGARRFQFLRRRMVSFRRAQFGCGMVPGLAPGASADIEMECLPLRRGELRLLMVRVARQDPLGFFRSFANVRMEERVLILPRRYRIPDLILPGALRHQAGGVALASNIGRSDEFVSLREYRHGDPRRHIHWRSWARTGRPIVKEFADENFVRHALVLDTFEEDPLGGRLEEAVSVAASFGCSVLNQESLLDLLFVGDRAYCFTAGRGLAHAEQVMEILASVQRSAAHSFHSFQLMVQGHLNLVSGCICVLLQWDEQRQELVRKIKQSGVPLLALVLVQEGSNAEQDRASVPEAAGDLHFLELGKIQEMLMRIQ